MRAMSASIATVVWLTAAAAPAPAQTATTPRPPPAAEKTTPDVPSGRPGETLSERLSRTEGVIKPPENIAPDMRVPAPDPTPNTTPVIPPPGSPGGDPSIQPK